MSRRFAASDRRGSQEVRPYVAEGMDEIAHIEELLWEFSDFNRRRYFEIEGEWMAYVIQHTFHQL